MTIRAINPKIVTNLILMRKTIIGAPGITGVTPELPKPVEAIFQNRAYFDPIKKSPSGPKKRITIIRKHGLK